MRYLKNVTTLKYYPEKCTGCGICVQVCPQDVFTLQNDKAVLKNPDSCMECGACAKNCAFSALEVRAGVGCAAGILTGFVRGSEPSCGCSGSSSSCCG